MNEGRFVITDSQGTIIRVLNWQNPTLNLIRRLDTGRIEPVADVKPLDKKQIPYRLLTSATQREVKKQPLPITGLGYLQWQPVVGAPQMSPRPAKEQSQFGDFFKWSALAQICLLIFVLLIGSMMNPEEKEEERIVRVIEQRHLIRERKKIPVVKVAKKKIKKRKIRKNTRISNRTSPKKRIRRVTKKRVIKRVNRRAKPPVAVSKIGALAALGGGHKNGKGKGGNLNLSKVKTRGYGKAGGKAGIGGMEKALYGKGLVSSAPGRGMKAGGGGRYKTRGRAGGNAGYGTMKIAGAAAYSEPLQEDAFIQGGLDRDQVHAVIQRNLGQIVYCYEKGLQKNPKLAGRVSVKFVIGGNGRVDTASIAQSSLRSSRVESCILKRLSRWKFPKPTGNVRVSVRYPFALRRLNQG